MKLRLTIILALACLLPALPATAGRAQGADALTEERVLAVIAALDKAARAAKIDAVAPHLADDFKFKAAAEIAGNKHDLELGRAEYLAIGKRSFSKQLAYECKREKSEVSISKDGQSAMVTSEAFEKMTARDGVTLNTASSEIYVFKLRAGKVVLTSKYATIRVL